MYKTTGQKFTLLSFKVNPNESGVYRVNFNQLSNSIRLAADKKDKICTISDKIYVLLTKSDDLSVEDFINRVYNSLPSTDPKSISVLMLKINDRFNSAEEILTEFDLEAARVQLSQR